jgi:hypothetical protein
MDIQSKSATPAVTPRMAEVFASLVEIANI